MNKNISLTNQTGQTIAELLVACFIILIGLAAILTASISILNTVSVSKDIVIATNLAREGLEVVRNKRDNNWLAGAIFDNGLNFGGQAKNITKLLVNINTVNLNNFVQADSIINCEPDCVLYLSPVILYNHTLGEKTKFSRLITLTPICKKATDFPDVDIDCVQPLPGDKIGIKTESQVGWQQKSSWRIVTLREYLYDWKLP